MFWAEDLTSAFEGLVAFGGGVDRERGFGTAPEVGIIHGMAPNEVPLPFDPFVLVACGLPFDSVQLAGNSPAGCINSEESTGVFSAKRFGAMGCTDLCLDEAILLPDFDPCIDGSCVSFGTAAPPPEPEAAGIMLNRPFMIVAVLSGVSVCFGASSNASMASPGRCRLRSP